MNEPSNNIRIAKNTLVLYVRLIVVLAISLYTSRVILHTLGVSDYGVVNVVGGVIGMLGYVNTLLSGATSRFLTFDLGKGDILELKHTFGISNTLSLISVAAFLLLGETLGLWFVNTHLNIDPSRMHAANWVYQSALMCASVTVLQTPYYAAAIAHEKMGVYAVVGITDAVLKLVIAFAIAWSDSDRLVQYSILLLAVSAVDFLIYFFYCIRHFEECRPELYFEKKKFIEMFSFSGWNMIMAFANVLNNYGLNILLNVFFGTIVNAARGIAVQVNSLASQFYSGFQTAAIPQITKYYAQGEVQAMSQLVNNTSKFSAYLLLCLIIPIWFNVDGILSVWLGTVPDYSADFVRIMLLTSLCSAIDLPVGMGIHAVGKMKLPNLTSAFLYLSVFPITYIAFKLGASVVAGYVIYVAVAPLILCLDVWILFHYSGFSPVSFIKDSLAPVLAVGVLSLSLPFALNYIAPESGMWNTIWKSLVDAMFVVVIIFCVGLSKADRNKMIAFINRKFKTAQG